MGGCDVNFFKRMNPKQKQVAVIGGAFFGAVAVVSLSMLNQAEPPAPTRSSDGSIRHVLTDRDSREVTMGSLSTQLAATQQEYQALREQFSRLQANVAASNNGTMGVPAAVTREMDSLSREIDLLREENRELRQRTESLRDIEEMALSAWAREAEGQVVEETATGTLDEAGSGHQDTGKPLEQPTFPTFEPPGMELTESAIFAQRPVTRRSAPEASVERDAGEGQEQASAASRLEIRTHSREPRESDGEGGGGEPAVYLPAGSIVSGVLLNGLDAPTSQGARRDPFPVTVRIKREAILPNHFSADVKECFMLLSGYGDLSTERALLRGNNISCLTDSGEVIETELRGYAVGEDGKAGIRGRLVSKQGAMIARSMVAGFFSGASRAFDVSPIPVIDTNRSTDGRTQYQTNASTALFQGAGAQGASQALDRVAQFYVEMAESIFPVVEVSVGRSIDVILTQGISMKPNEKLTNN